MTMLTPTMKRAATYDISDSDDASSMIVKTYMIFIHSLYDLEINLYALKLIMNYSSLIDKIVFSI